MKIAIIVASTRQNRAGRQVGDWVLEQAKDRTDASYELVDLLDFNLPMLSTPVPPAALAGNYAEREVDAWAKKIAEFEGYVLVTPEYNHSVPAAMKNAFDQLGSEWMKKTIAFVGYGADGGVRAVDAWRLVVANFNMYDVRNALAINVFTEMSGDGFRPAERRAQEIADLFDTLEPATKALATLR